MKLVVFNRYPPQDAIRYATLRHPALHARTNINKQSKPELQYQYPINASLYPQEPKSILIPRFHLLPLSSSTSPNSPPSRSPVDFYTTRSSPLSPQQPAALSRHPG